MRLISGRCGGGGGQALFVEKKNFEGFSYYWEVAVFYYVVLEVSYTEEQLFLPLTSQNN